VLTRIGRLSVVPAAAYFRPPVLEAGPEFRLMAERGHHHMPALPPFGVIAVMADDKSRAAVIPRINSRYRRRVKARGFAGLPIPAAGP
jgi:hypothetical protein